MKNKKDRVIITGIVIKYYGFKKKLSFLTNDVLGNFMKICQFTIINSNEQG